MSLFRKSRPQPWSEELFDQVTRHGLHLRLFSMTLTRTYVPSDPGQAYYGRPAIPARLYLENWQVEGIITGRKHRLINCTIEIVRDPPWADARPRPVSSTTGTKPRSHSCFLILKANSKTLCARVLRRSNRSIRCAASRYK